ncbi:unnamed protein product [Protopolystoma xenopodis]|uniref:Uncharacterized protein n=1 Tax=Protopolystoma xenopodis TaxID=117903 RepID=A0A448X6B8_9PLAT|nr:unnamed protein product [Protopolystoma xenopodis]
MSFLPCSCEEHQHYLRNGTGSLCNPYPVQPGCLALARSELSLPSASAASLGPPRRRHARRQDMPSSSIAMGSRTFSTNISSTAASAESAYSPGVPANAMASLSRRMSPARQSSGVSERGQFGDESLPHQQTTVSPLISTSRSASRQSLNNLPGGLSLSCTFILF